MLGNISGNYGILAWGFLTGFKKYKQMTYIIFKFALVAQKSFFFLFHHSRIETHSL